MTRPEHLPDHLIPEEEAHVTHPVDLPPETRTETDSLGSSRSRPTPTGASTPRGRSRTSRSRKRPISVYPDLVRALASVKQASARANREIGVLDAEKADLIDRACQRIIDGEFHDQFVVGVIQGGAGTSTNMNANEVITNVALELAGPREGRLRLPAPRSTTSTAASRRTTSTRPRSSSRWPSRCRRCSTSSTCCARRSLAKAVEFHDVLKVGRTQLQDAVPMTLGQEFHGFATTLGEDYDRLTENV